MQAMPPTREDDAETRRQRRVLAVVLLGVATTTFPLSLLAASLDTIRTDLHTSLSTISWLQVAPSLASGVSVTAAF